MQKWEYLTAIERTVDKKRVLRAWGENYPIEERVSVFDRLGQKGWELVGIDPRIATSKESFSSWAYTYTDVIYYWFKRPIDEGAG